MGLVGEKHGGLLVDWFETEPVAELAVEIAFWRTKQIEQVHLDRSVSTGNV